MVSAEDRDELREASELIVRVIERHRGEDLRALSIFTSALQELRVGARYLAATDPD
ncbi:hypothetical protein [Prauserella muralis]|uniref:hypothetical protein n=1 Tax=Prauserella muralis TaxID=588067 RepID=UPI0011AC20B6|nr:hypothetical protein [Prauserella muralis]TWE23784.1 hypothetical protein FHX69_5084 [Prauserella muralis]